jgi:hypothetical protein
MRLDRIGGGLAVALTLTACSPEAPPRDASAAAPGTATEAARTPAPRMEAPAATEAPRAPSAAEPEPAVDPDPQAGVELPEPPVRVPETVPAG